jgi:transcription-repair coupling factor (superfamily II helicase)
VSAATTQRLKGSRRWTDLPGDGLAWAISHRFRDEPALIVVDGPDAAERLARGLRFFVDMPDRVEVFPADDVRPYDGFSPSPWIPGQRARVLLRVERGDPVLVVAPAQALVATVPSATAQAEATWEARPGDRIDRDVVLRRLDAVGYLAVPHVEAPGHVAARGDVVDVWSPGQPAPRRIDWFDDEIESIRGLDARTMRPTRNLKRIVVLPAREERLDAATRERLADALRTHADAREDGPALRRQVLEDLAAGIRFSGLEAYLPGLVPCVPPLSRLRALQQVVVHPSSVAASARDAVADAHKRWAALPDDERPLWPSSARWIDPEVVIAELESAITVHELAAGDDVARAGFEAVEGWAVRGTDLAGALNRLRKLADTPLALAIVAPDTAAAHRFEQLVEPHGLGLVGRARHLDCALGEVSLLVGDLPRGFIARDEGVAFVPTSALFGQRERESNRRAHALFERAVGTLSDLKDGDFVVHKVHGIGRFQGLQRIDVDGVAQDVATLVYRDGDLLLLPVTSLSELSRYTSASAEIEVKLDRLGGQTWAKRKAGVRDALLERAQDLLRLQARRALATRAPWPYGGEVQDAVHQRFPHQETPDQARAILDVHDDLSRDVPMDRLLCGDVGFGKTEVAMRAAARVVEAGAQVAVLCPTTVLAFQHALTFRKRFEGLPVRIAQLSRFSTPSEVAETLAGLADGSIDLCVGTHRLFARDVRFKRLGLVVLDEEQRFGVDQKDRLKALRTEVDVLSMSATPIPRTLQLALAGARDLSVMATPPAERLEIRTTLARMTQARVRDAILTELGRGGQVYVVHNRIETLGPLAEQLKSWVPEARFELAHGKMDGERIERVLVDFMARRFDVLVCTAIVETGVDLPNVNTMLVDRADQFGLAQLYQLRGRVGRSDVRGNCLLLTPETLTADARRRLQVLVENTRLGSGFAVAAADLELRGGGNLLGANQSGHIDAVGFETWVSLLEEAVAMARGDAEREQIEPVIEIPVPAFLPESLLPDMTARLGWYQRLANAINEKNLEIASRELELEAGGDLPVEARNLVGILDVKLVARRLGLPRVAWGRARVLFEFHPATRVPSAGLAELVQASPKRFSLEPRNGIVRLAVRVTPTEAEKPIRLVRWVLAQLDGAARASGSR